MSQAVPVYEGIKLSTTTIYDSNDNPIIFPTGPSNFITDNATQTISGSKTFTGSTTQLLSDTTLIADSMLYLNSRYTSTSGKSCGLIVNYKSTNTVDTIGVGGFTSGTIGSINATVATTSASTFSAGDIIQISDAVTPENNGIFEVQSHTANVLTIRGGSSSNTFDIFQQNFTTDSITTGTITKVNVSTHRSNPTTGVWEQAQGSTTAGMVFSSGGGSGTVTSISAGTGITATPGPITTTGSISIANTTVTAASYKILNATVNAQGQLTSASSASPGTSTTNAITKWGSTTADSILNSGILIDASNNITGANIITAVSENLTATSNQLVLGAPAASITITAPAPAASRTYIIPDVLAAGVFALSTNTPAIGQVLTATSVGGAATWQTPAPPGTGTVTSVALTTPAFLTVTGSPITTSGTLSLSLSGTALPISSGGTNSVTALNNNRIMVSSASAIIEAAALTNGQILIGSTGAAPVAASLTGTINQVNITNAAGSITLATPQNIHTAATPTFASTNLTAVTNQLVLGTTNTATISATAPAASRVYTIADPGANASFVMTAGAQTIAGIKTFSSQIPITATTNQLVLGTTNTITITSPAPAASRTYTIPDVLANASFVMTAGAQTIAGIKTFSSQIPISATTNQLVLGTTNTITITSPAPAASRTYTIPDVATAGTFTLATNTPAVGQVLTATSVGGAATWQTPAPPGTGTVTSVALTTPAFISVTGSPITTSGTLSLSLSGTALPISSGGTNSVTALNNNRIMVSSTNSIIEAAALTNGQLLIGSTGAAPVAASLTGTTNQVNVTNGAGSITLSTPQDIHTAATPTFSSTNLTAVTNQLVLGTTNTTTISAAAPASSRTYTIPDTSSNSSFVMTDSTQTVNGIKTFSSQIPITATTNQLVLGAPAASITITAPAPASSRTYIIPDVLAAGVFALATNTPAVGQVLTATSVGGAATWQTPTSGGTVTSVALTTPAFLSVTGSPITTSGTLSLSLSGTALPISSGGTNSVTALNNNRIMVSSANSIIEAAALTNGQLLIGSTGATPVAASLTGTTNQVNVTNGAGSITLSTPQNIHTAATPTFASTNLTAVTNQLVLGTTNTTTINAAAPVASRTYTIPDVAAAGTFTLATNTPAVGQVLTATSVGGAATWQTPTSATVTSVALTTPAFLSVTGSPITTSGTLSLSLSGTALPITSGGTNSVTALNNNRIMVSSANSIVEAPALTNGQLLIGSTGATPTPTSLTGTTNQVNVTNGAGSITLSTPQNIHTAATPTFASTNLTAVTNQLVLGTTNTTTISAVAPTSSHTYTIPDTATNSSFVMTDGDQTINGNKLFSGNKTDLNSTTTTIKDAVLYINNSYTSTTGVSGGISVNYKATTTVDTIATGGFTAGVINVTNATCKTTGAATFTAGDIIQITNASNINNNGVFEVASHSANTLTIKGGSTVNAFDIFQQTFTGSTVVAGNITKINLSVNRANPSTGIWETNTPAATTTGMVFTAPLNYASGTIGSMYLVRDEKPSGTAPQNGVSGQWTTRNLTNTYGTTVGVTFAANTVTLPAGTYHVFGWASGGNNQQNTARLFNSTDSTVLTVGTPMSSNSASITTVSSIDFLFTIAAGKGLRLQSYSANNNVMGRANGIASTIEIYSYLRFTRIN